MRKIDLITFVAALACAGCFGAAEEESTRSESPEARIREFERKFVPAEEDRARRPDGTVAPAPQRPGETTVPSTPVSESPEEVAGFRIQLFSTTDIDEAGVKKHEAELLFPEEWIYLQYDQPTYKIRAGNFLRRFDAERFRTLAIDRGFGGAWIVPSRIVKNPPPPKRHQAEQRPQ